MAQLQLRNPDIKRRKFAINLALFLFYFLCVFTYLYNIGFGYLCLVFRFERSISILSVRPRETNLYVCVYFRGGNLPIILLLRGKPCGFNTSPIKKYISTLKEIQKVHFKRERKLTGQLECKRGGYQSGEEVRIIPTYKQTAAGENTKRRHRHRYHCHHRQCYH